MLALQQQGFLRQQAVAPPKSTRGRLGLRLSAALGDLRDLRKSIRQGDRPPCRQEGEEEPGGSACASALTASLSGSEHSLLLAGQNDRGGRQLNARLLRLQVGNDKPPRSCAAAASASTAVYTLFVSSKCRLPLSRQPENLRSSRLAAPAHNRTPFSRPRAHGHAPCPRPPPAASCWRRSKPGNSWEQTCDR